MKKHPKGFPNKRSKLNEACSSQVAHIKINEKMQKLADESV